MSEWHGHLHKWVSDKETYPYLFLLFVLLLAPGTWILVRFFPFFPYKLLSNDYNLVSCIILSFFILLTIPASYPLASFPFPLSPVCTPIVPCPLFPYPLPCFHCPYLRDPCPAFMAYALALYTLYLATWCHKIQSRSIDKRRKILISDDVKAF